MEIYIYSALAIIVVLLIIQKLGKRKQAPKRNATFLIGDIGAGKTSLIYHVLNIG